MARRKSLHVGEEEEGDGISAIWEKLLGDPKVATMKMKDAVFQRRLRREDEGRREI